MLSWSSIGCVHVLVHGLGFGCRGVDAVCGLRVCVCACVCWSCKQKTGIGPCVVVRQKRVLC